MWWGREGQKGHQDIFPSSRSLFESTGKHDQLTNQKPGYLPESWQKPTLDQSEVFKLLVVLLMSDSREPRRPFCLCQIQTVLFRLEMFLTWTTLIFLPSQWCLRSKWSVVRFSSFSFNFLMNVYQCFLCKLWTHVSGHINVPLLNWQLFLYIWQDGTRQRRFLVVDLMQIILIEPDSHRLGWGVAKFSGFLQVS